MNFKQVAITIFLAAAATPVLAGEFYLSGAAGLSRINVDQHAIDRELARAGATGLNSSKDETDTAYKVQVGYRFNPYFAVEGGYVDLGRASYTGSFNGGSANASIRAQGMIAAALAILPVSESLSLFGKVGVINAKAVTELHATGVAVSVSNTALRANFGLGATYKLTKDIGARVEYEQFQRLGETNGGTQKVDLWSVGLTYGF